MSRKSYWNGYIVLSNGKHATAHLSGYDCERAGRCVCGFCKGQGQCEFGDCRNPLPAGAKVGNLCARCSKSSWRAALPGLHASA